MNLHIRLFMVSMFFMLTLSTSCQNKNDTQDSMILMAAMSETGNHGVKKDGAAELALNLPGHGEKSRGVFRQNVGNVSKRDVEDVVRVTLEVSAPDMSEPLIVDLFEYNGSWGGIVGSIPAGSNRTFLARAYDISDHLIYEGAAEGVTIVSGTTASVYILLMDSIPVEPYGNVAPIIDALSLSASTVGINETVNITVTAHDDNAGDTLSYEWNASCGSFDNTEIASPVWTAPSTEGSCELSVTVADESDAEATMNANITVDNDSGVAIIDTDFNNFPYITKISATPTDLDVNETTQLEVTAMDLDGEGLTYSWSSDCGGSFDDSTGINPVFTTPSTYPSANLCTLSVQVIDGRGGINTGDMTIHVRSPLSSNVAPVIHVAYQSSSTTLTEQNVALYVEATDPEGQPITFNWSVSSGGSLDTPVTTATTSRVNFNALTEGSYTITVSVMDDGLYHTDYTYTVVVGSYLFDETKMTITGLASADQFGQNVIMDEHYALVGSGSIDGAGSNRGAVYVYEKNVAGNWEQTAHLTPSSPHDGDGFSKSMAISGDYIIVGASGASGGWGAVYIFEKNPATGNWIEKRLYTSDLSSGDALGSSVSISGDFAFMGTPSKASGGNNYVGAVYVFQRDPLTGNWYQMQKIMASDAAIGDRFGSSVSVRGDYAVIGATYESSKKGAVYVFEKDASSGDWLEVSKLVGSDVTLTNSYFGSSVVTSDNRFIVSRSGDNSFGGVYVFEKDPGTGDWGETAILHGSDVDSGDHFGTSISLWEDRVVVGASWSEEIGINRGSAYLFEYDNITRTWTEVKKLTTYGALDNDVYGASVSIFDHDLVVGSPGYDEEVNEQGAVYFYKISP